MRVLELINRLKKFDLDTVYFGKKDDSEKKESVKN